MTIYPDSSFLVSLYSPDRNSAAAAAAVHRVDGDLIISPLVELEVVNAIEQRVFRKEDTKERARRSSEQFEQDVRLGLFRSLPLPEFLFERARELSLRTTAAIGTRAIDLLHVAAAVELGAEAFFSFDERQRTLAGSLRLKLNELT